MYSENRIVHQQPENVAKRQNSTVWTKGLISCGPRTFKMPVLSEGAVSVDLRSPNNLAAAQGSATPRELMGGLCWLQDKILYCYVYCWLQDNNLYC